MEYYSNKNVILYNGKMQEVLPKFIKDNSIDSIVTDPPYELNFMNKGWDNSGVAFQKETWEHCYRVLKEGGYLLAFGGSRTYHRIACAIEDAGFEIRDTIMWLYGSGFPSEKGNSASRYFYCAKASKKDRDEGLDEFEEKQTTDGNIRTNSETGRKFGANSSLRKNIHPTVKPTDLMQYLVRLVTPANGVILDPFMGSGSTGKAVMYENNEKNKNYSFIGVEMTNEYLPIAKARIYYAQNGKVLDKQEKKQETQQLTLFDFI